MPVSFGLGGGGAARFGHGDATHGAFEGETARGGEGEATLFASATRRVGGDAGDVGFAALTSFGVLVAMARLGVREGAPGAAAAEVVFGAFGGHGEVGKMKGSGRTRGS